MFTFKFTARQTLIICAYICLLETKEFIHKCKHPTAKEMVEEKFKNILPAHLNNANGQFKFVISGRWNRRYYPAKTSFYLIKPLFRIKSNALSIVFVPNRSSQRFFEPPIDVARVMLHPDGTYKLHPLFTSSTNEDEMRKKILQAPGIHVGQNNEEQVILTL